MGIDEFQLKLDIVAQTLLDDIVTTAAARSRNAYELPLEDGIFHYRQKVVDTFHCHFEEWNDEKSYKPNA